MKKLILALFSFVALTVAGSYISEVRAEAATGLWQETYCSGTSSRVDFHWSGPGSSPDAVWLDLSGAGGSNWNVTGANSFPNVPLINVGNYSWRINAYWENDGSGQYWYPSGWRSFTSENCDPNPESALLVATFNNGGNYPATVSYTFKKGDGDAVNSGSEVVAGFDSRTVTYSHIPASGPYSVLWDPLKDRGADVRDVRGNEPLTELAFQGIGPGGEQEWTANVNFECWDGTQPVGGGSPVPASGLSASASCASSTEASVNFNWSPASGSTFDQQYHDYTVGPTTSGDQNGQAVSVGAGSVTRTLPHNSTIYWRINTHSSTTGLWYTSSVASFSIPNCTVVSVPDGPTGLSATQSCAGGFPSVTFNWNTSAGADDYWVDVTTDGFGNFSNRNTTGNSAGWSASSPFLGGFSVTQTPQNSISYQWRVYAVNSAGGNHSGTAGIATNNCAVGSPPGVDMTANGSQGPITVASGSSVTLAWVTVNTPDSCTASGAWSGAKATGGGSQSVTVSANSTFTMTCAKSGYSNVADSVSVNIAVVGAPTVDITANGSQGPITVASGSSVTLAWTTTNTPTSCSGSGAWSGSKATGGGSQSVTVSANSTFTISCSNLSGSGSDSVTVNIGAVVNPEGCTVETGAQTGTGWIWLGNGNSTHAGTNTWCTIGTVNSSATRIAFALWATEADATVSGNQGNYTTTFSGSSCTRSDGPWSGRSDNEGACMIVAGTASNFTYDSNYPNPPFTTSISECDLRYTASARTIEFQDTNTGEDCAYAIFVEILPPTPPSNLNVSGLPACATGNYTATFNWTTSVNGAVDIDNDGDWGNGYLAFKSVSSGTSTAVPAGFNNGLVLSPGVTYYWRIYYGVSGTHMYDYNPGADSTTGPGNPFSVPTCLDLKARFVKPLPTNPYNVGESANATVRVSNIGGQASAATTLGLWASPGDPAAPSCPGSPASPPVGKSWSVSALSPGASTDIPITFDVGSTKGLFTANAYVIPLCNQTDSFWGNNSTSGNGQVGESDVYPVMVGGFTYNVDVNSWFETTDGDVGSQNGNITISQLAPSSPAKFNSEYLIAAGGSLDKAKSQNNWTISSYAGHRLVPTGGIYNYLADRFRSKATGSDRCNITAGLPSGNNFYQCTGDAAFHVGNGPNGNNVFFIDGNLVVDGNLTLASADTSIFIVKGNITININVTRIDGIYVAGGWFSDTDPATESDDAGGQLVVNGSVYANSVLLSRYLGGSCGATCNNLTDAANVINYQPKYIMALNSIISSPSISWNEVAP